LQTSPFWFTQHQCSLKFSSGGVFAFFPSKNGLFHNSVDFAPKLLQYLRDLGLFTMVLHWQGSFRRVTANTAKGLE